MARKKRRLDGRLEKKVTVGGKVFHVYGATKAELEAKAEEKRKEYESGTYSSKITLREYYEVWFADWQKTVKESTANTIAGQFKRLARVPVNKQRTFGDLQLQEIQGQTIKNAREFLCAHYYDIRTNTFRTDRGYMTSGINALMRLLSHILQTAVNERIIAWNPCKGIKCLRRTEEAARDTIHRALTREETDAFLEAAKKSWYYNAFCLMLASGLRCGEVGGLQLQDIKKDCLEIRRTATLDKNYNAIVGQDAKTKAGIRTIPMTPQIRSAIEREKRRRALIFGDKIEDFNRPIFLDTTGGVIQTRTVDRVIAQICERIGVQRFAAHAFRDTFATRAIESGMNPKTLQTILGHANIAMTMNLYVHTMDETKAKEMQNVIAF